MPGFLFLLERAGEEQGILASARGVIREFTVETCSNIRRANATRLQSKLYGMNLLMNTGRQRKSGDKSLDPHSLANARQHAAALLEAQLRQSFARVVYSHKTHEKCADILQSRLECIKLWQIGLSALTTGGCVSIAFGTGTWGAFISALLSTALLALNVYMKNYDLGEVSQKHRQAGASLWIIREKYVSLITDLRIAPESIDDIKVERDELLDNLQAAYSGAPSTNVSGYKKAQKALKDHEEMTFSDEEINSFLPQELGKE